MGRAAVLSDLRGGPLQEVPARPQQAAMLAAEIGDPITEIGEVDMVATNNATKCSHCQGQFRVDELENELVCMNCGRREVAAEAATSDKPKGTGVQIVITLTPKNFPELADALASAKGHSSGKAYLMAKGASNGMAGEMMKGNILHVAALKEICRDSAITAGDFMKLLGATNPLDKAAPRTAGAGFGQKNCPHCNELIGPRSKKCRHCGSEV